MSLIKIISSLVHVNELVVFYPRLRKFYKKFVHKSNPIIIDVGANKGQTIDFFLKIYTNPVLYAFEPNPSLYQFLVNKYKSYSNVNLYNLGVSDATGILTFHENKMDETSSFEELNYESKYLKTKSKILGVTPEGIIAKSYEVKVISLSDFIAEKNLKFIDVIKIDTEGHEYKCLKGLFASGAKEVKYLQLEQHFDDMYAHTVSFEEIKQYLKMQGFEIAAKIKHGFGDFEENIYINNKQF